jgi:subtilisin family serine protease
MMSHAQTEQSVPILDNESSGAWFVELASPPGIDGTAASTLDREEAGFYAAAASAGVRYTKGQRFRTLWNGVTVRASGGNVAKLRALPGVQAVYPVVKIAAQQLEEPPGVGADLVTALGMTGADIAQSELGLSGRGVKVAVIDSGVDYDHPDLGGCFGRGCRVEKGFDFVGDAFNADEASPAYSPTPVPDRFPDDCNGHGTHVSGIIGANGGITGVAPGVTFHAYRVFGCAGPTTAEIMLAAMERAQHEGADVVNMSIGSALTWPQYPTATAADKLVKHGVVVVASIGNEGALGLYGASAPGIGKDVIGVASFDNSHANLVAFTISPDGTKIGYIAATGAPPPPTTGSFPMTRTGTPTSASDGCAALPAGSQTGNVVLIRRGTCSFYQKAFNAQTAGAAGVVLYNNAAGFVSPTVVGTPPITIPVVSITAAKGVLIDGRIASGPVTMTWTSLVTSEPLPTGGLISSFSSYGLAADLSMKPDIGAPGGTIRSTLPLEQGGYGNLSGTSMSSPHVAGAVALLLEARPDARPREVEQRLQNTAQPKLWWGNPGLGFLDNVHRQGAGMLRIDDAVTADAIVSPSSLALGEIETGTVTKRLRISLDELDDDRDHHHWGHKHHGKGHDAPDPVTYTLSHVAALSTGANTFTPSFRTAFASVTFSAPTVTIGGGKNHHADEAWVDVTIAPPAADPGSRLFGGYIIFTPNDGGTVLRVPYGGYNGDYQGIVVLTPTPAGFPWLAKVVGTNFVNQPGGATFTLEGDDIPYILLHLDHQSRTLKLEVIDLGTGESAGFADIEDFLPRNSSATSFFAFTWDGTTMNRPGGQTRPVPDGAYRMELSVLKALGDPDNPAHTEHWTSPTIVIDRP